VDEDDMTRMATAKGQWRTPNTLDGLRRRYSTMHPLMFQRTIERANSAGEAFDMLESIPPTFPIIWDEQKRQWVSLTDMWLEPESDGK